MRRREELYLRDIAGAADDVARFLRNLTYERFAQHDLVKSAVMHKLGMHRLTIIGEAASQLSQQFRDRHPEVPWAAIIRFRNRAVHHYFGVDWQIVWEAATLDAPALRRQVQDILEDEF